MTQNYFVKIEQDDEVENKEVCIKKPTDTSLEPCSEEELNNEDIKERDEESEQNNEFIMMLDEPLDSHDVKVFKCDQCPKEFAKKCHYALHMRTHKD